MTKRKDPKDFRPNGRPSKFKDEYIELAYHYSLLGAVDRQMADFFDVTEKTFNNWKHDHPEFLQSIKRGKIIADSIVAESLYRRALGYTHPEEKIFQHEGRIIRAETLKHYPPDTTAAIFWLKNRQRENWREKVDHEHTGKVEITRIEREIVRPAGQEPLAAGPDVPKTNGEAKANGSAPDTQTA